MDVLQSYSVRRLLSAKDWKQPLLVYTLILVFFTLGIVLLTWLPGEIVSSDSNYFPLYYPTHLGIGCAIWGTMSLFFATGGLLIACQKAVSKAPQPDVEAKSSQEDSVPDLVDFDQVQDFRGQLKHPWAMFGFQLTRCVLNVSLHIYAFVAISQRQREPDKLLDQSKRAVAWLEGPVCIFAAGRLCFALVSWARGCTGLTLVRTIRIYSGFSVLRCLPQANLQVAGANISKEIARGERLQATYHFCWWLFWTVLAALAVLVKIAEVDFITEDHWWNWTPWNYFVLAGFLNNLAGLQGDQTEKELQAVCSHYGCEADDMNQKVQDFQQELGKRCLTAFGPEGALVMLLMPKEILTRSLKISPVHRMLRSTLDLEVECIGQPSRDGHTRTITGATE